MGTLHHRIRHISSPFEPRASDAVLTPCIRGDFHPLSRIKFEIAKRLVQRDKASVIMESATHPSEEEVGFGLVGGDEEEVIDDAHQELM